MFELSRRDLVAASSGLAIPGDAFAQDRFPNHRSPHDAFEKAQEDPKLQDALDKCCRPVLYMGTEEYSRYAQTTFEAERATISRMGLLKKD